MAIPVLLGAVLGALAFWLLMGLINAVARTHVVEHLVIPSGQADSAGAVPQADVLDDPLPLRVT